jgi:hypothetical protein
LRIGGEVRGGTPEILVVEDVNLRGAEDADRGNLIVAGVEVRNLLSGCIALLPTLEVVVLVNADDIPPVAPAALGV